MTNPDAADAGRGREYACYTCKDWRTVTVDDEHGSALRVEPCPECQPAKWKASRIAAPGCLVAVRSVSQLCTVVLPSSVGMEGETCIEVGQKCCQPVVLVQSVAGGDPWWADLSDVEVVT